MFFDFTAKTVNRKFDASEWKATKPIFFKTLNAFEAMLVNELFEVYRNIDAPLEDRFKASFDMVKIGLVDENGDAVLTDADFEAVKNAPAAPIMRAWCYAMSSDYNRGETFKKK